MYYLNGWKHLTLEVTRMAVLVACTSSVSEAALELILEDDRLALLLTEVLEAMEAQRKRVLSIGEKTLEVLAGICVWTVRELRHEIMLSVMVQWSYIMNKFRDVMKLPWRLLRDDLAVNLENLKRSPR